ncbi:MAG: 3'-5' exonuclease [Kiritimatiellae bacterium]|nr:3'-5' exonuclease [Kiritimatiellia bacterium]
MLARDCTFTVIDFETTGSVRGLPDEPWQFGAVELRGEDIRVLRDDCLRIDPARPFNPYAPGRHAELRGVLAAAPAPRALLPEWLPFLAGGPGRVLVAHNAATEKRILAALAPLLPLGPWVDTLKLARAVLPGRAGYELARVVRDAGLEGTARGLCPGRDWHDALFDATATAVLLRAWLASSQWRGVAADAIAER